MSWRAWPARAMAALQQRWLGLLGTADHYAEILLNFFRVEANESMSRLCAFIFCLVAAEIGDGALRVAIHNAAGAQTADIVKALSSLAGVFVISGCVALLSRTKPKNPTGKDTSAGDDAR